MYFSSDLKVEREDVMSDQLQFILDYTELLELQEGDCILEISHGQELVAPVLKNKFSSLQLSVDLAILQKGSLKTEALGYYNQVFFMPLTDAWYLAKDHYDAIVILTAFNTFEKQQGITILKQLLPHTKFIYLGINTENGSNTWLIPDFKSFDFSFFNLPGNKQKLIKIYQQQTHPSLEPLPLLKAEGRLSILYVLPHQNLTGGLKMLYEQMKALKKRGHRITVMIRGTYNQVVPSWVTDFVPDQEFVLNSQASYIDDLDGIDIIFAGFYNQISELKNDRVPVLYWEQGHEFLYGDVGSKQQEPLIRESMNQQFKEEVYYATDSQYVHDIVKTRFHRESYILPIFIDPTYYYPMSEKNTEDLLTILLVGNPYLSFKGFIQALEVLWKVWQEGYRFKVKWACQMKPTVTPLPFEIEFYENLPQLQLAELYRQSDILLSCSIYEGCPMPPLEAMASGVAVVSTNSGGINQYAKHGVNALIASTNTVNELAKLVQLVLTNQELREQLTKNGRLTATELSDENGARLLEQILHSVISDYKGKHPRNLKQRSKKKVLFMIGTLLGGGAEKVLCNLVKQLDPNQFEMTVQTIFDQGIYIEEVKQYVTYKTIFKSTASNELEAQQLLHDYQSLASLAIDDFSRAVITECYDIEIAFLEDQSTRVIAHSPNPSARKIAWVHADLIEEPGSLQFYKDLIEQKECYQTFDDIVCVSKGVKEAFIKKFNIQSNYHVIYNPIDTEEILKKSQEKLDEQWKSNTFKVLAVGRLVPQKGFQRLLRVHHKLMEEGYNYELWIIGDGILKESLARYIKDNQLEAHTKLLGFQSNPYKYMAASDLFISCSETEGFSLVIAEALVLGLPVITTNCSGPLELIGNNEAGWVVSNDEASIYEGLKFLLTHTIDYVAYQKRAHDRGKQFNIRETINQVEALLLNDSSENSQVNASSETNG